MGRLADALIAAARGHAPAGATPAAERHRRECSSIALHRPGDAAETVAAYLRPGGDIRVWQYPGDPFLPALSRLAAPGELGWARDAVGWEGATLTRLAYNPAQRAVFLVRRGPDAPPLVLRLLQPAAFARALLGTQVASALRRSAHIVTPHLVDFAPDAGALLVSFLPGVPAAELPPDAGPALAEAAALALAALHRSAAPAVPPWDVEADLRRSRALVEDLARWYPEPAAALMPLLDAIGERLRRAMGSPLALCHGDVSGRNALLDAAGGPALRLIDWDAAAYAPPERDIASVLSVLRRLGVAPEALLTPYERAAGRAVDLELCDTLHQHQRMLKLARGLLHGDEPRAGAVDRIAAGLGLRTAGGAR